MEAMYDQLSTEVKSLYGVGDLDVDTGGEIQLLNGMQRGTADGTRIARRINMIALELRAYVSTPVDADEQTGRLMIVYDRQPNGIALAITDVINTSNPVGVKQYDNDKRFEILYDETYCIRKHGTEFKQPHFEIEIPMNHIVHYNSGNAGSVADILYGSLYVISVGNVAAAVEDTGTFNFRYCMRYLDY